MNVLFRIGVLGLLSAIVFALMQLIQDVRDIKRAATPEITATRMESRGLQYRQLDDGFYRIVTVMNKYDGTALVRRSIAGHDSIDLVVTNIPRGMLVKDKSFSIRWG